MKNQIHLITELIHNQFIQMLNLFFTILGKPSATDKILKSQTKIEVRAKPAELIKQLHSQGFSKFIAKINEKPEVPLLAIRKLSIVHYILIHYPECAEQFEAVCLKIKTQDAWLNENIIRPYSVYLYKVIHESESYCESKLSQTLEISFKLLFYTLNMLKDLFPCVKKMSNLSRYYIKTEKEINSSLTVDYVSMIAFEAQELYNCFKAVLGEMITKPQKYVTTEPQKFMIKNVIDDQLPKINEQMKNLFLDKYYFPYGKGFGVKLLKEEDLNEKNQDLMESFSVLQQKSKYKKPKKMTLDKLLFGEKGHLNPEIILSLSQIRHDDSINSSRNKHQRSCLTDRFEGYSQQEERTQKI